MKNLLLIFLFCCSAPCFAQVAGRVTSSSGQPVPFAVITVEGTYKSVLTNKEGNYSLRTGTGVYSIIYQAIGYKSLKREVKVSGSPVTVDVTLEPETYLPAEDEERREAATQIMRKAIAARQANADKTAAYTANFYSLGEYRLNNVPRQVLDKELGRLSPYLDSTGTGIIYISETSSQIKSRAPGDFYEHITASRVGGDDSGYSYNNAMDANFNFYNNYLPFTVSVVSPLADNAFSYYDYELESSFTAAGGATVNKIKVTPKVKTQPVAGGDIYIEGSSYQLYALELTIPGSRIKEPLINSLTIKQLFTYHADAGTWVKTAQLLELDAALLQIGLEGTFTHVYGNYDFKPVFTKKDFGSELVYYEPEANQKDNTYWNDARMIPLTEEERVDYDDKSRIEKLSKSEVYLDSIDRIRNTFKWYSPALGYTYTNTHDNWKATYTGIATRLAFNTVQAYWLAPGFYFTKYQPGSKNYTSFGTDLNYGFAEQRFRATGFITHKFSSFTNRIVTLSGGSSIVQYNRENPINKIVNSISTLFFRENYMKLYDNTFIKLQYDEEVINGIALRASMAYTRRHALRNNTDYSTLKDIYNPYMSNNPLLPYDYDTPAFLKHTMYIGAIGAHITFGQQYLTLPGWRQVLIDNKYPEIDINFEKGFGASISDYNFNHLSARVRYDITFGDKGELGLNLRGGKFFDSENIAFTDYRHFNGNQTYVGKSGRYLDVFNLLPYYTHSTSNQYFEGHAEHNFKGYLLNSIPGINKLNFYLVAGYHFLALPERNPYMEYTIGLDNVGWGKARFFRFDYIHSQEGSRSNNGVIFGVTFLDFLE